MKTSLLVAVCVLSFATSQSRAGEPPLRGATAEEERVLTPEQIFRDSVVGDTRIEFQIRAVSLGGTPFDMEEATGRTPVSTADGKASVSRLRVIVSEKVEARLKQLGIEDLRTYFYGKMVRVSGNLKQEVAADCSGNKLITYSLTIDSLDQIEFVRKK
jgi:hypothetical protein